MTHQPMGVAMTSMNISLPKPMRDWVQTQIETGKYAGNSDYIRDLIRKDQQQQQKILALQQAITKGLESGTAKDFDIESFKQRMLKNLDESSL
jgi:antitoxin ParD1/3/4